MPQKDRSVSIDYLVPGLNTQVLSSGDSSLCDAESHLGQLTLDQYVREQLCFVISTIYPPRTEIVKLVMTPGNKK